ncbi:MAG TPA: lasso peptide biosynthesis B2 protein [Actinopolymorphaceae bacterium]
MNGVSFRAYAALVQGRRLLKSGGWKALVAALPPMPSTESTGVDVRSIAAVCERAARRLPLGTACLERSYATCSVLRRHGVPSRLCVGVSKFPPMRFHAWVEVGEEVLNEPLPVHDIYRTMCAL